jgi:hypothetical protein
MHCTLQRTCKTVLNAAILSLLAAGCSVYRAQSTDIPLIDHRGMVNANVGGSLYRAQASVSAGLTDNLAASASYSFDSPTNHYGHLMAGWYRPLDRAVFELYGGIGTGKGEHYVSPDRYDGEPIYTHANYQLYFVQADYGWNDLTNSHIDLGFALKGGLMHFNYTDQGTVKVKTNSLFVEPTVQFRIGGRHLKFCIAAGICLTDWSKASVFPLSFNTGINFKF